jgi:hypothetical protein
VILEFHDTLRSFTADIVLVTESPERMCSSPSNRALLSPDRKPRLEADAGCFRGQVGERGEFVLYTPSQNNRD